MTRAPRVPSPWLILPVISARWCRVSLRSSARALEYAGSLISRPSRPSGFSRRPAITARDAEAARSDLDRLFRGAVFLKQRSQGAVASFQFLHEPGEASRVRESVIHLAGELLDPKAGGPGSRDRTCNSPVIASIFSRVPRRPGQAFLAEFRVLDHLAHQPFASFQRVQDLAQRHRDIVQVLRDVGRACSKIAVSCSTGISDPGPEPQVPGSRR